MRALAPTAVLCNAITRRIRRIPFQSKYEWLETTHPALAIKLINSIARYRGYSPFGQLARAARIGRGSFMLASQVRLL